MNFLPPSGGGGGGGGDSAYVYIAYASDDQGANFSLTVPNDYIAILSTTTAIPAPQAGDFAGLWQKVKGEPGHDMVIQYSVLGGDDAIWSDDPTDAAYIRFSTDGGTEWTEAKFKGDDGTGGGGGVVWETKSESFTAEVGHGYLVDSSADAVVATAPASLALGDSFTVVDLAGTDLTVARNGHKIHGVEENLVVDIAKASITLTYSGADFGLVATGGVQ